MRRPREVSAGLLVFRHREEVEVLLGHPGGPFWARKDAGTWTIPKGVVGQGEDILAAARREFAEETSLAAPGEAKALQPVNLKSGKTVFAFALEADLDLTGFASNTFEMEWPPKSGQRESFPEIDRIAYFTLPVAAVKILAYQLPLLKELARSLG
jgi:predicted NUDIX family NTP pyrophosphohydrolase